MLSRSLATACERENGKAQYGNEFEASSPLLSVLTKMLGCLLPFQVIGHVYEADHTTASPQVSCRPAVVSLPYME